METIIGADGTRYEVVKSITCPVCQRTSWHPEDVKQGYCGACHWWTSNEAMAGLNRASRGTRGTSRRTRIIEPGQ